MDKKSENGRKRLRRRLRASVFLRRNGIYVAIAVCLAVIGGISAALLGGRGSKPSSPAERSYDERLGDAGNTAAPEPTQFALPTFFPYFPEHTSRPERTPLPTVMPDLTPAPSSEPTPAPGENWTSPVDGRLLKGFAMDCLIYSKTLGQWMTHPGVDAAAPKGSEVRSVDDGTVAKVYDDDMLGTTVVIDHGGGLETVYSGLKKDPPVKEGDAVKARDLIGYVGDTAISECADESHLHFEVHKDGRPVDPEGYVVFRKE